MRINQFRQEPVSGFILRGQRAHRSLRRPGRQQRAD